MNMEKIEAEIRMFDRIELIFAICAATAAAILLILIAIRMKRNEVKPGKGALIISMAVLVVTGIYTGAVVFADEESLAAESESPHMDLIENAEMSGDAKIAITGIASEGCCIKMVVADSEESAGTETPVEETPAEEAPVEETPVEEAPVEETPAEETPVEEIPAEETSVEEIPEPSGQEEKPYCGDSAANGRTEDVAAETTELSEEAEETGELSEEAEDTCERSGSDEAAESTIKEIEISLFTGAEYDDAAAREMVMTEQVECFDAAGLILKEIVIEDGFLRSLAFGLKEVGRKNIKVSLIYAGDTQEMEFILCKDETEEAGEEYGQNSDETSDSTETGGSAGGYDETVNNDDMTVTESEYGQQSGGVVPGDDQEIVYEEGENGGGQTPIEENEEQVPGENDENNGEDHTPAEDDEKVGEEQDAEEGDEKIEKDEEPPVIIIRPDDEGSGFKVSADTEEAVSNVYISEAKEVRIIESNAEEIEDAEIVYTVNGETYPMEYGADYEIEKVTTDGGWQYEYVVAPHVFEKDGYYNINITSKDRSGNISNNKTAGTEVSFVVDRTPPAVIVTNLDDGGVYEEGEHEYKVTIKDNTLLKYFRIYENKKMKAEYLYDREKWINTHDKTDVLEAPGGTVTLRAEASGEAKTIEFEAEDESGNVYRSSGYSIIAGKSRSLKVIPFAVTAASLTLVTALAVKHSGFRKTQARRKRRGRR